MGRSIIKTKKRKSSCNQRLKSSKIIQLDTSVFDPSLSASSKKRVNTELSGKKKNYNILLNFDILKLMISESKWPKCGNEVSLENDLKSKNGFCFYLTLQSLCCPYSKGWRKSQFCTKKSKSTSGVPTAKKFLTLVCISAITAFNDGSTAV